jgi:hypothetical protein
MKGYQVLRMILLPAHREDAAGRGLLMAMIVAFAFHLVIFIKCLLMTRRTMATT